MIGRLADGAVGMVRAAHRRRTWLSAGALVLTLVIATAYLFFGALRVNPLASSYRVTIELPESGGLLADQNVTLHGVPI
ncbi:MAG: MlaD family protein, partial [Mycobacterium sp.]